MQWKPNATVAAIAEQDGRFLLVEEKINGNLVFNQPAGHLEQGETLIEAVKREVLEETAWEFEPRSLVGVYLYPHPHQDDITYLRFCFFGDCIKEHKGQALDEGIVRAAWLSQRRLRKNTIACEVPWSDVALMTISTGIVILSTYSIIIFRTILNGE